MQTEEILGVLQDSDGAPLSFKYQGVSYLVSSRPVRWYSRKLWWELADSAPRGIGSAVMETEMWRLWASAGAASAFFEIRHQLPQDIWVVQEVR
ncbi:MAG: hypothetical protein RL718_859 [Actinomycetota bacterium]|jgi:hypothetical protein